MFPIDIQSIIVSYIDNETDLISWKHTCKQTFNPFIANFYFHKITSIFIVKKLFLCSKIKKIHNK